MTEIDPEDFMLCLFCILELAETLPPEAIHQLPICAGKPSIFCWRKQQRSQEYIWSEEYLKMDD